MPNKTSPHILNTAATLLGFCLFIITSLHLADKTENSIIDEFAYGIALMLALSCVFSFLSIRTQAARIENVLEKTADLLFLVALIGIIVMIAFISLNS